MSLLCPPSRRQVRFSLALALWAPCLAFGAPPRVLDRIPQNADAILAVDSVTRLDQNSSQLLTSIDLNAVSTLSQALGAMGLRDGLDLSGSAAGVFFNHAEGPEARTRFVLLLPVQNYDLFMGNLRAESDAPAHRFEYAGATYFARDLGGGLAALGPDRDLVVAFDAGAGQLAGHLNRFGPRGRELADRADLLVIADARSLAPLLAGALGPLLEGAPGAGLTDALMGEDPRSRFAAKFLEGVIAQSDVALLSAQAGPLGLRLDLAVPFKPESELAALCQAAPARPSGLLTLPRRDYLFLGSLNLSHPGLRQLFVSALEPPPGDPKDPRDAQAEPLFDAFRALRSVDTASIAVYTPPSLMLGALTQTALAWESRATGAGADPFRQFIESMNGRPVFAPTRAGAAGGDARPVGAIQARLAPAEPPFSMPPGESAQQWAIELPPGASPTSALLFGLGAGPAGYFGVTHSRSVVTWSRDRALFESCMQSARAPQPGESAADDVMLSQVAALLPEDRCLEWFLNVRPALQMTLPMMGLAGQAPPKLPDLLPPVGASVSLSDGSLHAAAFIPAPLMRVVVGVVNRIDTGAPPAQRGQNPRPR